MLRGRLPSYDESVESEGSVEMDIEEMKQRMSNEANKEIRERYRNLLIEQQEKVDRAGESGLPIDELKSMVSLANDEASKLKRPKEAALDAEYLKICGNLLKVAIEKRQFNSTEFRPTEFAQKLIKFTQPDSEANVDLRDHAYWKRLGKAVSPIYRSAATVESTYAGIDYEKPKKVRLQRKRIEEKIAAKIEPKKVLEVTNEEETQTGELSRIFSILKRKYRENGKKPLCFFRFVVNPTSYSLTIENIFHTSFLVNLLRAEIIEDKEGMPVIIPAGQVGSLEEGSCKKVQNSQCVVSLSTEEFKELVKVFNITESTIPPPPQMNKRSEPL